MQRLDEVLDKIKPEKIGISQDIQPVKLILCDISMPIMNGWQTIKTVRKLYSQKQAEIDKYKTQDTGHKIITL